MLSSIMGNTAFDDLENLLRVYPNTAAKKQLGAVPSGMSDAEISKRIFEDPTAPLPSGTGRSRSPSKEHNPQSVADLFIYSTEKK
jgi:hypothetical protein